MTDTVVGLDVDDLKDHLRYKLRRTRAAHSHPSRRHDARCAALAENVFQALNGAQAALVRTVLWYGAVLRTCG